MRSAIRMRFLGEAGLAVSCGILAFVTVLWPHWIEAVFGVDPDRRSGSLEYLLVLALAAVGLTSGLLARLEWRRRHVASRPA